MASRLYRSIPQIVAPVDNPERLTRSKTAIPPSSITKNRLTGCG